MYVLKMFLIFGLFKAQNKYKLGSYKNKCKTCLQHCTEVQKLDEKSSNLSDI